MYKRGADRGGGASSTSSSKPANTTSSQPSARQAATTTSSTTAASTVVPAMAAKSDASRKCYEDVFTLPRADVGEGVHGFSLDFGNSLVKIAYIKESQRDEDPVNVHLVSYTMSDLDQALQFIKETLLDPLNGKTDPKFFSYATGACLLMYREKIMKVLDLTLKEDIEFACFAKGIKYLVDKRDETDYVSYTGYSVARSVPDRPPPVDQILGATMMAIKSEQGAAEAAKSPPPKYPCLVVFAGSAFAMEKVYEDGTFDTFMPRNMGGLYFHGLGKLLTGCQSYEELIEMALKGDTTAVSFTVRDFPPGALKQGDIDFTEVFMDESFTNVGLPFSKVVRDGVENPKKEDVANTVLHAFCGDLVYHCLNAARRVDCQRVYLCGSFCNNNPLLEAYVKRLELADMYIERPLLAMSILKHVGYIGSIGHLLRACDDLAAKE